MAKFINKKNLYGWIILVAVLIPTCIISVIGINRFLFFMQETPLYLSMSRYDDLDMSIKAPETWHFDNDESGFHLINNAKTENIYLVEVKSANSMDVAKDMFSLAFKDSYMGELDYKEGTIDGNPEIYYISYSQNNDYYVTGVIKKDDIYANFSYKTSLANTNMSPLSTMLASIDLTRVPKQDSSKIDNQ